MSNSRISMLQFISLAVIVCIVVILFGLFTQNGIFFSQLPLKENIDVVSIFSGTLIIIALIERSIELFIDLICENPEEKQDKKQKKEIINKRRNTALILGLFLGLIASLVGIRILEPLVIIDDVDSPQKEIFILCDIIFSTIGIAEGSKLFHVFPSLTSSVLGAAKEQSDANIESAKLQKEQSKLDRMPMELENKESEKKIEIIEREKEDIRFEKIQKQIESTKLQRKNLEFPRVEQQIESENSQTADSLEDKSEKENQQ